MSAPEEKKRVFQSDSDIKCRVSDVANADSFLGRERYKPSLLTQDSVTITLPWLPPPLGCQDQGTSELLLPFGSPSRGWPGPSQAAW